jgi:cytochrome c-type biogenesis protein CcmF
MIAEIGHFALALSLVLSIVLALLPMAGSFIGGARGRVLMDTATPASLALFGLSLFSFLCLGLLFVGNDFTVKLVATHSNLDLPIAYRIAATWGSHEGSMLLWVLMLAGWTAAVAVWSGSLPQILRVRILSTLGLVTIGFVLFLLYTSNPFKRLIPAPADGRDLNPLLQDPGMVFHPPLLYMGYVGLSVAFAFAVAGLIGGRFDAAWARWARPWTTVAWAFLTLGIALGSFWAYYELGWGGWWFWDPVENASFMPWLIGTALMHSLAATEKRGVFKQWTVLLAILAFGLSLLGTFLVRSGVLTSVHAFASDPARGTYILAFLCVVLGGSLTLFAFRAAAFRVESRYAPLSREMMILANNVLLVTATAYVLGGTLFPIVAEAVGMGKVSVGAPFFNDVAAPLAMLMATLTGVGPLLNWKRHSAGALVKLLVLVFSLSTVAALALVSLLMSSLPPYVVVTVALSIATVTLMFRDLWFKVRTARAGLLAGWQRLPAGYRGMQVAHFGFVVMLSGIAFVSAFDLEKDVRLAPGESAEVEGYTFRFDEVKTVKGPNYISTKGVFSVYHGEALVAELHPEKRQYRVQTSVMTEAAIDGGFWRDLYVALGEPLDDKSWAVRLYYKPLMRWVWFGALIMALGGLIALTDRRYRLPVRQSIAGATAGAEGRA